MELPETWLNELFYAGIETFSHEEVFVVYKLDDDNHVWIRKKNSDDEPFTVHKNRLFFNIFHSHFIFFKFSFMFHFVYIQCFEFFLNE